MTYKWEELTSPVFAETVKQVGGVCIIPIGCMEKHGDHLPLGTDVFVVRNVAEMAVQQEPAIIFPYHFLAWIHDGKHWPGAVAVRSELVLELMESICEEIARNGMNKIIILNGHGGNGPFLDYFMWRQMEKKRPYLVYYCRLDHYLFGTQDEDVIPHGYGHAGEGETSTMLATNAAIVRMEDVAPPPQRQGRLDHLPPRSTTFGWQADWMSHYCGDAAAEGTAAKGQVLLERMAARVAGVIKAVREDTALAEISDEFFGMIDHS